MRSTRLKSRVISIALSLLMVMTFMPEIGFMETVHAADHMTGAGTAEDPYLISDEAGLREFATIVNNNEKIDAFAELTADITLTNSWTPISNATAVANQYKGTFDGKSHTIKGLSINATSSYQGLFGSINGATIKNLNVEGSVSSSKAYVGGIVGKIQQGTIENCSFSGTVSTSTAGTSGYVGGITGYAGNSTTQKAQIKGCVNRAAVIGGAAGGVAGYVKYSTIDDSYNTGTITGDGRSGGIAGQAQNNVTISNCYNIGTISGSSANKADIVDFLYSSAKLVNCYYTDKAFGTGNSDNVTGGGVINKDTLLSDLGNAFVADTNNINNGYPILAWEAGAEIVPADPEIRITQANPLYITNNQANPSETVKVSYTEIDESNKINWSIVSGNDVITLQTITDGNANNSQIKVIAQKAGIAKVKAETEDGMYSAEATINVFPGITTFELEKTIYAGEKTSAKVNCLGGAEYDVENYPELKGFTWKYYDGQYDYLNNPSSGTRINGDGMEITVPAEAKGKWLTATLNYQGTDLTPSYNKVVQIVGRIPVTAVTINGATSSDSGLTAKTGTQLTAVPQGADEEVPTGVSYQWQKYDSDWSDVADATSDKFTIPDSKDELNKKYRVKVTGEAESAAISAEVTVTELSDKVQDEEVLAEIADKYAFGVLRPTFGVDSNACTFLKNDIEGKGYEGVDVSIKSVEKRSYPAVGDAQIANDGALTYFYYDPLDTQSNSPSSNFDVVFTLTKGDASADLEKTVQLRWDIDKLVAALKTRVADKVDAEAIKGENDSLAEVTEQLELPRYISEDGSKKMLCEIKWASSDNNVIEIKSKDSSDLLSDYIGQVTRTGEDKTVTLTATFDYKNAETAGEKEGIASLTKTFEVTVKAKPVLTPEELGAILDTYYMDKLTYSELTEPFDASAVKGDIQLPLYTRIKDADGNPVFNNKEIVVSSDDDAAKINGYRVNIDRFASNSDKQVTLTVTFTRDGVTATRTIPLTIKAITEAEVQAELDMMEIAKAHYFDGINDGQYENKNRITGNLHPFQEMNLDSDNKPVWIYQNSEMTGNGIIPDGFFDDSEEMEAAGYNRFKSSDKTVITHDNLLVTRAEEDKKVTITSWLSSSKYKESAKNHPENEVLQKLYKQEVSVEVTVKGTADPKKVLEDKISEAGELLDSIVEGSGEGEYPAGTKSDMSSAIAAAQAVLDDEDATEDEIQDAVDDLNDAITAAKESMNPITVKPIKVDFTVSDKGVLAKDKNGGAMVAKEVTVTDVDDNGMISYDEALVAAHEAYCSEGADGYKASMGTYGLEVKKLWGVNTSNALFIQNDIPIIENVGDKAINDGDSLYASINKDTVNYADAYAYFDKKSAYATAGQSLELTLSGVCTMATLPADGLKGVQIGTWDNGSFKAIDGVTAGDGGKVTITFDEPGEYIVTASGTVTGTVDHDENWAPCDPRPAELPIMAPYCVVKVMELDDLVARLEAAEKALKEAQDALADAQAALSAAQSASSAKDSEIASLKEQLAKAQEDLKAAKEALEAAQGSSEADKKAIADLTEKLTSAQNALKAAQEALEKAAADKEAAEAEVKKAQDELALARQIIAIQKKTVLKIKVKGQKKKAKVTWKSLGKGFKYEVYRCKKINGKFKKVKTVKKTKAVIKKMKSKKTFYFKVRAFKKVGGKKVYTQFSNTVKAKIK